MVGIITANSSSEGNEEYKVIPLALAAENTLKSGLPSIFHSKDSSKKSIHVHKAIAGCILERFK
jgi:hypothetical protein